MDVPSENGSRFSKKDTCSIKSYLQSEKFNFSGRNPSISISRDGKAVVVVSQGHVAPFRYRMYSFTGQISSESQYQIKWNHNSYSQIPAVGLCSEPSIALANSGAVILVYHKIWPEFFISTSSKCYCRVGALKKDGEIDWGKETGLGKGSSASVDVSDGNNPTVIVGYIGTTGLSYGRTGIADLHSKKIIWNNAGKQVLTGLQSVSDLSISINAHQCIAVVYHSTVDLKKAITRIYSRIGRVKDDGSITLRAAVEEVGTGWKPTISINRESLVIVMWQSYTLRKLCYRCGVATGAPSIQWKGVACDELEHGCKPSVSLTNNNEVLEVHESGEFFSLCFQRYELICTGQSAESTPANSKHVNTKELAETKQMVAKSPENELAGGLPHNDKPPDQPTGYDYQRNMMLMIIIIVAFVAFSAVMFVAVVLVLHGTNTATVKYGVDYSKPTLSLLEDLNGVKILEQIGTKYSQFGTIILNEERGDIVNNIIHDCTNNVECINQQIVRKWLQGGERYHKPTWNELISVLCSIRLNTLAESIVMQLQQVRIYITTNSTDC